ncbi:hypothetical protein [Okeania sp. SIO2B3]|nr:hypothetical protein [Okeania sp. SIO2B3]
MVKIEGNVFSNFKANTEGDGVSLPKRTFGEYKNAQTFTCQWFDN